MIVLNENCSGDIPFFCKKITKDNLDKNFSFLDWGNLNLLFFEHIVSLNLVMCLFSLHCFSPGDVHKNDIIYLDLKVNNIFLMISRSEQFDSLGVSERGAFLKSTEAHKLLFFLNSFFRNFTSKCLLRCRKMTFIGKVFLSEWLQCSYYESNF